MKPQRAAAFLITSVALATAPIIASADSTPAANGISVLDVAGGTMPIVGNPTETPLSGPDFVRIKFTNESAQPATEVEFQVDSAYGSSGLVNDVGTFSTGAVISHRFSDVGGPGSTASVVAVRYADGSEWTSGSPNAFVSRRQSVDLTPPADTPSEGY